MARGYRPKKSSDDKSNLFAQGGNDPILKRMLGPALLAKLGGRKPAPMDNFQRAREYFLQQQAKKKTRS